MRPPFSEVPWVFSNVSSGPPFDGLTTTQREPITGVHTIQAVAPNNAMPAPATVYKYNTLYHLICIPGLIDGYNVASWFGMIKIISTSHTTWTFCTCLQAKTYPQVYKSVRVFSYAHIFFLELSQRMKAFTQEESLRSSVPWAADTEQPNISTVVSPPEDTELWQLPQDQLMRKYEF